MQEEAKQESAKKVKTENKPKAAKKKKRRLKKEVKLVLGLFIGIVAAVIIVMVHKSKTAFKYENSLDEVVLTVSDCNITLREISYYVIKIEEDVNTTALIYNPDVPTQYWGLYMNDNFNRSGYVSDLAKNSIIDYCTRDNIYYMEAVKNGFSLTSEEEAEVIYDAKTKYASQTTRQAACGLSEADYQLVMIKEETAHQYMLKLASEDGSGVVTAVTQKYDVGGYIYSYFQDLYPATVNHKIWDEVRVGFVTIN